MSEYLQKPEDAGFVSDQLSKAYEVMSSAVREGTLLGGSIQVSRDGKTLPPACFGRRQLTENGLKMDPDTIFLVASITKPIIAGAVMMLVERGEASLDDQVAAIVPEFGQNGKKEVQLCHLLTHTSGLPDMLPDNLELRARFAPMSKFIERICAIPLMFQPGTRISYQSCGIAMLGEIVRRLDGREIHEFQREEFFEALGLLDTTLGKKENRSDREAEIRIPEGDFEYGAAEALQWNWNSVYWRDLGAPWGGMMTTVSEMTRMCQVYLQGGSLNGVRVLAPATVTAMTKDQTSNFPDIIRSDRRERRWGLGWEIQGRGSSIFSDLASDETFGHTGATGTVTWMDPKTQTTCVIFTNDPAGVAPLRPRIGHAVAAALI